MQTESAIEKKKPESQSSPQPIMQKIYTRRIKIDPQKIKCFNIKLGEQEYETYATPRHKYDWTKSKGVNSGWADVEELAESIKKDGIIHTPLVCSFTKFGYDEEIVAVQGWRRIRAATLNKSEYIDADYTEDLTPEEAEILSFKENHNRKNLSDSEISQFLWRIRQRHPNWTYEKIGEIFGLGGKNPESKRKAVGSYISHHDFLARHQQDVQELDIKPRDLTRTVTIQIQATAREIVCDEKKEEFETEILKAHSKNSVPI
ncbi:MAG: ParB/RepB/Spo0J family partition protein, partial [Candidatus Lokiarchaeia archaeon]